jgi:hypothetical protein
MPQDQKNNREIGLLDTTKPNYNGSYWDAELIVVIKGQKALKTIQWTTITKLYKNWGDWRIRLAVWLIGTTKM